MECSECRHLHKNVNGYINRMYYTINKRGSKKKIREFMHVVYTRTNAALNRFQIDLWFDRPLNQHEMSVHRN